MMPATQPAPGSARAGPVRLGATAAARCRRRIHLDHDPTADRTILVPQNEGMRHRFQDFSDHADRVLDRARSLLGATSDWTADSPARPAVVQSPSWRRGVSSALPIS